MDPGITTDRIPTTAIMGDRRITGITGIEFTTTIITIIIITAIELTNHDVKDEMSWLGESFRGSALFLLDQANG
jgi:hypothetical protein